MEHWREYIASRWTSRVLRTICPTFQVSLTDSSGIPISGETAYVTKPNICKKKSAPIPAIVGGIVGGVALLSICVLFILMKRRRAKRRVQEEEAHPQYERQVQPPPPSNQTPSTDTSSKFSMVDKRDTISSVPTLHHSGAQSDMFSEVEKDYPAYPSQGHSRPTSTASPSLRSPPLSPRMAPISPSLGPVRSNNPLMMNLSTTAAVSATTPSMGGTTPLPEPMSRR